MLSVLVVPIEWLSGVLKHSDWLHPGLIICIRCLLRSGLLDLLCISASEARPSHIQHSYQRVWSCWKSRASFWRTCWHETRTLLFATQSRDLRCSDVRMRKERPGTMEEDSGEIHWSASKFEQFEQLLFKRAGFVVDIQITVTLDITSKKR